MEYLAIRIHRSNYKFNLLNPVSYDFLTLAILRLTFLIYGTIIPYYCLSAMNDLLYAAVLKLLHPLVRILLRNGVTYGIFADLARRVFVSVASEESGVRGKKQTMARISVITGLNRKAVGQIKKIPAFRSTQAAKKFNRAARVIGGWIQDERFMDSKGKPLELPVEGPGPSFNGLVRSFSGDATVRSILDELMRVGAVEKTPEGRIRLLVRAYIPRMDGEGILNILGFDVRDLISTIDHNIIVSQSQTGEKFFQRRLSYDNLPVEVLPKLRAKTGKKGQKLLEAMNLWLSRYDRDVNPNVRGTGRKRAGIGVYYFEEDSGDGGDAS
jgi:hypothetical protein